VTTGNVFADLGFSRAEAQELAIKSDLHMALLRQIRRNGMTQKEIAKRLQIHQPDVSNSLRGRLSLFSLGKLCRFAARLNLQVRIAVGPSALAQRKVRSVRKPASPSKPGVPGTILAQTPALRPGVFA
jgi:predicted XRE-type DNA-binding protein